MALIALILAIVAIVLWLLLYFLVARKVGAHLKEVEVFQGKVRVELNNAGGGDPGTPPPPPCGLWTC